MAGLLEWSNSIRYTMATDPGKQVFQDQLRTHGFIFLDDYLHNILSGPCQDPLIELVKTPGRKKVSKKPKSAGVSKLNSFVSLEDGEEFKENAAPVNNLHSALLRAKDQAAVHATNFHHPGELQQQSITDFTTGDDIFSPTSAPSAKGAAYTSTISQLSTTELHVLSRSEQNDLSVIAEDDENSELNRSSRPLSHHCPASSPPAQSAQFGHGPSATAIARPHDKNVTELSAERFHSITLDSPQNETHEDMPNSPVPTPPTASEPCEVKPSLAMESNAAPILDIPLGTPTKMQEEATPARASSSTLEQDINIPLRDHDHAPQSPKSSDKFGVALFPALPAPMPLRKSMRAARDLSTSTGQSNAATPGAQPGGKRTSWLKKAREVKALEVTSKHTSTPAPPVSSTALKRKSGDLLMDPGMTGLEDEERRYKSAKNRDGDVAPSIGETELRCEPPPRPSTPEHAPTGQEGMLDRFRRTVEGLGAKVGKSVGKPLGAGAAASALAEARAAAEARVAERHYKEEEMTRVTGPALPLPTKDVVSPAGVSSVPSKRESGERRLSVSDLFPPNDGCVKIKSKTGKSFQPATPVSETLSANLSEANRESTTTTPPDSPPIIRPASAIPVSGPVFNKPPPVFVPPVPVTKPPRKGISGNSPSITTLSTHVPTSVGITSHLTAPSSSTCVPSMSKQFTLENTKSDAIFGDTDLPAWVPHTQDPEYSSVFGSQSQIPHQNVLDEDDSWPLDEKLAAGVQWAFGSANAKEDSMTWSTLPSQSQRADTSTSHNEHSAPQRDEAHSTSRAIPGAFDIDMEDDREKDTEFAQGNSECEDVAIHGTSTVNDVEPTARRSESQMSMASSQSSQSQTGFLGQASKLLSSALGTSKKGKPEVKKVLQMAAAAAKKQQEENDKKAARLREMENRRQIAIQRKAEEEKTRALEQERKMREEGERRKREREEATDKRPLKAAIKKDEDATKKRKVTVTEVEKKELKKLPSKSALKPSLKQPSALSSSAAYNASLQITASSTSFKPPDSKPSKAPMAVSQKGKGTTSAKQLPVPDDDLSQPSHLVQIQMAARAKAQLQAADSACEPPIASESIELPEINSEYSDSEDEDRPKSFPEWAQSPELREALQSQSTINPDDIFGAIRPLRMEELFKTRTSRFRARTSSANWTGADRLTLEEEREYAKRMGFK